MLIQGDFVPGRGRPVLGPETKEAWTERYNDILLELPTRAKIDPGRTHGKASNSEPAPRDIDPSLRLKALRFTQYLESPKFFSNAMGAAHGYDHPLEVQARDRSNDPGSATFYRAAARLDAVDVLI